ncbi:glycine N-acyltransferase-like protein 2 isoform X2 [Xyrichtys novacula]|uniref:Glycine N-acyltransferase-like protein n=1 Tax=Xyrichtys novacula TaxID=13765 RepID=A0AAV1HHU5_XYRNO|nr:glycine N-acyltransferase-like protein 2 isoform X2 [Xyrichtys novacula]
MSNQAAIHAHHLPPPQQDPDRSLPRTSTCIPSAHCRLIKDLASLKGLDISEYGGYSTFIHHSPEGVDQLGMVLPLPVSILDQSHAGLVDKHLPYGGSRESLSHVRACIHHLPNHCVKDAKGRPVSWMLSDELCELRMAYTLPEYRRAGHLLALSVAQIRSMSSAGLPVYCHVNQRNQATINAVTSLGFSACPETASQNERGAECLTQHAIIHLGCVCCSDLPRCSCPHIPSLPTPHSPPPLAPTL